MKIKFIGAAREVTGSKHLIATDDGVNILLDCGMFQGKGLETDSMNKNLGFEPKDIDYLVLSHAHIDHAGLIPYIVKNGFEGMIVCTHGTRDLCAIMLADSARIQEHDTHTHNKKRAKEGLPPIEPIYTIKDAERSLGFFVSISYNNKFKINKNVSLVFTETGHILGGAAVNLTIKEGDETKRICYTGDIGRQRNLILRGPQPFPQADYLITESTYGDRLHDHQDDAQKKLLQVVVDTCVKKKGKLIIPSFSVGRTQEVVYSLHLLVNKGWLPKVKVFVDSPLSINATNIMRTHPESFNDDMLEQMEKDTDPFGFNNLIYVRTEDDSKKLNNYDEPCIIISASGMCEAGRIKHHLANSVSNKNNTVLFVGYCAPSTLGAKLKRGDPDVSIFGIRYAVKADIAVLESYSAHGDYNETILYLSCQDKKQLKKIFLVHGEYETQEKYKATMEQNLFTNIEIPEPMQEFSL
ncbi:MAG: MBL fold metallo-hydrolase [Bacteroidetes bacterium]|nr:MBL fold metallo-hydrolase [Bacteroidota bacterium]